MSQPANDEFSQHLSDDEASNHEDASDTGAAPKQQQQVIPQTTAISNIKLPILKKEEYDIWAMEMEHYLEYIDNDVWKVIQNGNSKKRISTGKDGVIRILPPVTAAEIQAVEKERKAKNILLMAIPKEHMRRFHGMDDAKEIWEAIRTRFGGNANSKKMQKAVFKQQFEAFTISSSEGLEKGYDIFQQLLSQLEAHGAEVSTEDANHKFLKSLPPAWSNLAMTMRTKPDVDTLSIDDLYNNLRVFEQEIQGASKTSLSAQNVAFVSQSKNSSNKVKSSFTGGYSTCTPSTSSTNIPEKEALTGFADEVIYSLFAKQSEDWDLLHEDLEQIDDLDIKEMDINWQIAMIAIRMKKFYKKIRRRVCVDGKTPVGFDKKKLECFNCNNTGHFARECTAKGTHDGKKKRDSFYQHQEAGKQEKNQMGLLTMDDGIVNWGEHTKDEETNHALMAISSSSEDHPLKNMVDRGIFDSGCSGHMTGNKDQLEDFEEFNRGSVTFGGSKGYISGKGKIRVGNLDFDSVSFVKELGHFNLFSISQICDKQHKVLFTETECLVVSSDFKMPDENQILLKVPRHHNMYNFDMKTPTPAKGFSCLIAKATSNESKLWHRSEGSCGNTSEHSFETELESLSEPNEMSKLRLDVTNEKDVSAPKSKEVEPSCVSHIKTPRQPLKDKETIPLNLSHLIKDCDYYEKKMARRGLHTDLDKDDSEDSDEVGEQEESVTGTKTLINPVPVAMKIPSIATYKIIKQGEKGVYQIVREDGTDVVYINFGAMLKDISRDDLTELYRIVMNRYGMDGPEDELEKVFWKYLKNMFEEPLSTDPIWSELGQQRIISIIFREPPYLFDYPMRRLTMEEILGKFINEGRREHGEMEICIKEFRTTNELLLKTQSNLLSELVIEVNELSMVMSNVLIPKNESRSDN
ncbi:ribonuclease H-like domain-containing protein [Tanacetum coccineum]